MRTLAIGILVWLAGGCAARDFNLVPRDPEAPWQVAHHWVRMESNQATVNLAFNGIEYGHLVFDVEVVNQTDSTLHVDPTGFSYTLASDGEELPPNLKRRFPAKSPEAVLKTVERQINPTGLTAIAEFVATVVVLAAIAVDAVDVGDVAASYQDASGSDACVAQQPATADAASEEPAAPLTASSPAPDPWQTSRGHLRQSLLRNTELAPGATARGEIWLPAGPVQRAIGPEEMENDPSITAPKPHGPVFQGLTLRTPPQLGGQELDYSIAVD